MENGLKTLLPDERFTFLCAAHVPCFNECCRDLNQFLTPYDVIRLKNNLGVSSGEFIKTYTVQHPGPETGLPMISLKPNYCDGLACPFVGPHGCNVYEDRPSSCRTYPLVRFVSRSRETGRMTEQYAILKESHCLGFCENKTQTVREWVESQDITVFNQMNDLMMELISLKNRFRPGPMDIKSTFLFTLALYDMDTFREHVFEKRLLENFQVDSDTLKEAGSDDAALLKLGMKWLEKRFFDEDFQRNHNSEDYS